MKKKMDYFGAIGRMADAVIPKSKKSNLTPGWGFEMEDPFKVPASRQYKKFMHMGPAATKSLTKKQTHELIEDLRDRGYSAKKAKAMAVKADNFSSK